MRKRRSAGVVLTALTALVLTTVAITTAAVAAPATAEPFGPTEGRISTGNVLLTLGGLPVSVSALLSLGAVFPNGRV
ncbi:hypothetical protein [Arthrobacter sp. UYEF3]|uniref:hypothetical protein n=1 Tax=Arthrobacter sp. UYEF3 TaxID=1756365 RepID=UPI003391E051